MGSQVRNLLLFGAYVLVHRTVLFIRVGVRRYGVFDVMRPPRLLLAMMYLTMACLEEPFLSFNAVMAAAIMEAYVP